MADENDNPTPAEGAPTEGGKTYTQEEVQRMIEEQTSGLKNKVDELLGEKKSASQRAKELEEQQKQQE